MNLFFPKVSKIASDLSFDELFKKKYVSSSKFSFTRKYLLRGYFLGVLTHTTAWDRLWGGDETLIMWF